MATTCARRSQEESDEDEYEARLRHFEEMRRTPSYPFPADFKLEHSGTHIGVIRHLCNDHPAGTRAIALFFPGVHGGVGPCRTPGSNFDENALYATVARALCKAHAIDCYRCSWPFMRPNLGHAVGGACRVLHYAINAASDEDVESSAADGENQAEKPPRHFKVVFVGHSMGGSVVMRAAEAASRYFEENTVDGARVTVSGVCTLNGAVDVRQMFLDSSHAEDDEESSDLPLEELGHRVFRSLAAARGLFICGEEDQIVPNEATLNLHEAWPCRDKRCMVLPEGSHDLFNHKATVVEELTQFISSAVA